MGTRGTTIVIHKDKVVIGQYGQWDHYPSGQGITCLEFLKMMQRDQFEERLARCRFTTPEDEKSIEGDIECITGGKSGWMSPEQAERFNVLHPYLTRNHGAGILEMVHDSNDNVILLRDNSDYKTEGEYAYTVNLDKNTFEVYRGFDEQETVFNLDDLPDNQEFVDMVEPPEEDE